MNSTKFIFCLIYFLSATPVIAAWNDDLRGDNYSLNKYYKEKHDQKKTKKQHGSNMYIGVSMNSFSLNGSEITATNLSSGFSSTSSITTKDKGSATGFTVGAFFNDTKRINLSYFTGEEEDSSIFTVTATSVSIDHSFNTSGVHRGWFLGAGLSSVKLENKSISGITASSSRGVGLLARGGYEYKFDNQLFLDVGFNVHLVDIDHKFRGTGSTSHIEISTKLDVSNAYLSLNYVF